MKKKELSNLLLWVPAKWPKTAVAQESDSVSRSPRFSCCPQTPRPWCALPRLCVAQTQAGMGQGATHGSRKHPQQAPLAPSRPADSDVCPERTRTRPGWPGRGVPGLHAARLRFRQTLPIVMMTLPRLYLVCLQCATELNVFERKKISTNKIFLHVIADCPC